MRLLEYEQGIGKEKNDLLDDIGSVHPEIGIFVQDQGLQILRNEA